MVVPGCGSMQISCLIKVLKDSVCLHGARNGGSPDAVRKLGIGNEEGGDAARMQQPNKAVDLRVHYRLAH